ncbi:MAG: hypothetical protein PVI40_05465 [Chlamydiota bacterium]|jgi:uncharacterized protein YjbI with pentapeptide repeats
MSTVTPSNVVLPEVVWGQIASFLPVEQQIRDHRVCRSWQRVFKNDLCKFALMRSITRLPIVRIKTFLDKSPDLMTHLVHKRFNAILNPNSKFTGELLSKVIRCKYEEDFPSVIAYLRGLSEEQQKMIEVLDFSSDEPSNFTDEEVVEVLTLCSNLRSLNLTGSNITGECLAVTVLKSQLEKLILVRCYNLDENVLTDFFSKDVYLKEVNLSQTSITGGCLFEIPQNNQLERVLLGSCRNLDEDNLVYFFSSTTCLKGVDLCEAAITGRCLCQIPDASRLEELILDRCGSLEEDILAGFFLNAPNLKELNLSATNVTRSCLAHLPDTSRLERLILIGVKDFDDEFFTDFFLNAPNLKELNLSATNIKGRCLAQLSKSHQLESLILDCCGSLEEDILADFFSKAVHFKKFSLRFMKNITGTFLTHIPEENHLESLDLSYCQNLEEDALTRFFVNGVCLREIYLPDTLITGVCLTHIPEKNHLERLGLRHCKNLEEEVLGAFLANTHLKYLDLSSTNLTERCLAQIPKEKQPETLILRGYQRLT